MNSPSDSSTASSPSSPVVWLYLSLLRYFGQAQAPKIRRFAASSMISRVPGELFGRLGEPWGCPGEVLGGLGGAVGGSWGAVGWLLGAFGVQWGALGAGEISAGAASLDHSLFMWYFGHSA